MTAAGPWLWRLAGRPPHGRPVYDADGWCTCCGETLAGAGVRPKDALGINYDYSHAARPDSPWVCEGCTWSLAGRGTATLRLWTVAATTGRSLPSCHPKATLPVGSHIYLTNRADMRAVAALLTDPPDVEWVVSVAVTGQKHVAPYATVNRGVGPWRVRMETATVSGDPAELAHLIGRVARLREAGFGPDQIASGLPGTHLSTRDRVAAWRAHGEPLVPYRGSPLLHLATLIPTKEHLHDYLAAYPV